MPGAPLFVTREQVLSFRRGVQALDERLAPGPESLRRAAWAGLQDSVPRSALHSLHARVAAVPADALDDAALVQVWGPRYTAYVVPSDAHAAFTLARLPEKGRKRERALDLAERVDRHLAGRRLRADDAARGIGLHDNSLRYASLTGRLLIRWEGSREPTIWTAPTPEIEPMAALAELVRRYLHVYGPSTPDAFVRWGGIDAPLALAAFEGMRPELVATRSPLGDGWILASDEAGLRKPAVPAGAARLLPSGDPYYLLWGADREFLVSDAANRAALWTSRVWPGAVLLAGELVGTWRRAGTLVSVEPWRRLTNDERLAVEEEAATLPLPGASQPIRVSWVG